MAVSRDDQGRWLPGESPNPGGRPRNPVKVALDEALSRSIEGGERSAIEDVIDALIGAARQGDVSACEAILSRYLPRLRSAELRREESVTLTYVIDEQDREA